MICRSYNIFESTRTQWKDKEKFQIQIMINLIKGWTKEKNHELIFKGEKSYLLIESLRNHGFNKNIL